MRALFATALALLLAPSALATFELPDGRRFEADSRPGEATTFRVPVRATTDAHLYAKILPTPGNAVHDGAESNGTLEPPSGWRVAFAFEKGGEPPIELGTRIDSTPTDIVQLAAGDQGAWLLAVHQPTAATSGGTVYVALAERVPHSTQQTSGAQADDARAVTLRLGRESAPPEPPVERPTPGPALAVAVVALALAARVRCRR